MTIAIVSNASPPLTKFSAVAPNSLASKETVAPSAVSAPLLNQEADPFSVDTVNISTQSQQKAKDSEKEETKKATDLNNVGDKSSGAMAKVQFIYNPKGELSIRYMDTSSRLIYQTPSELMLRLKETLTKSVASVDTNV